MNLSIKHYFYSLLFILPLIFVASCDKDDDDSNKEIIISPSANAANEAQLAFIEAEDGTTIIFEEGEYDFTSTLSIDGKNNIIIKGAGRDNTTLDFSGQTTGGDGVLATNCTNIRFEDITIQDSEGDALKTRDCDGVSFVNVATVWSGEPSEDNGAYGLYPVLCTEVYIDNCYAYGASDAGIYVGQSDKVILKNSVAEGNVAGIEIENTTNADVFDNEAFDNTGGILVFDLPGLTQYGENVRVFNNNSHDNNRTNFAPAGNIVGNVPAGTGCMILSTSNVEVFDNDFTENDFTGILVASYLIIDEPNDPGYNAFPTGIYLHDNTHTMTGSVDNVNQPSLILDIIGLLESNSIEQPNIFTDGIYVVPTQICVQEGNASFVNLNIAADDTYQSIVTDASNHDCVKTALPEVVFTPF
ncbi:MAG: parallel beta-helix domain-containing protein [Chitinophagales bacterium]